MREASGLYNGADSMTQVRIQRSRYLAFSAILFGLFTVVADHGSIIIALPSIANHFESDLPTTQWVIHRICAGDQHHASANGQTGGPRGS